MDLEKYKWKIQDTKEVIRQVEKEIDDLCGYYNYKDDRRIIVGLNDLRMKLETISYQVGSLGADLYLDLQKESETK